MDMKWIDDIDRDWDNLCILMVDALRMDYHPDWNGTTDTTVDTICQGPSTPTNFPVIVSGHSPSVHGVSFFGDQMDIAPIMNHPDYVGSYWDHPDDPMYRVFHYPRRMSLRKTIKESRSKSRPFIYVERDTSTHVIYGKNWRKDNLQIRDVKDGRVYDDLDGSEYIQLMREEKVDYRSDYEHGVELAKKRVEELKDILLSRDVYGDTLYVITADHGEALPDDNRQSIIHNFICDLTINVETTFYGRELPLIEKNEPIRSMDILNIFDNDVPSELLELDIEYSEDELDIQPGPKKY